MVETGNREQGMTFKRVEFKFAKRKKAPRGKKEKHIISTTRIKYNGSLLSLMRHHACET
jgi:hypothetical protein